MGKKHKLDETYNVEELRSTINKRRKFVHKEDEELLYHGKQLGTSGEDAFGEQEKKGKRKNRQMRDWKQTSGRLTWEEAEKLLVENEHSGLVKVRERRHIALPFHQLRGIERCTRYIAEAQVGKFRCQVKGIVLAVGEISAVRALRLIDDHNVFHYDVYIEQIVFRPQKDVIYEAIVTMVSTGVISSSLFGQITVVSPINDKAKAVLRGLTLRTGDSIMVKYRNSTVKNAIAVLNAELTRIVKRGSEETCSAKGKSRKWDGDGEVKPKVEEGEYEEKTPKKQHKKEKKKSKKITFADSDNEESGWM